MKNPQVINLIEDSVIAIDGDSVIDDTTQVNLGTPGYTHPNIPVNIILYDITTGLSITTISNAAMVYNENADHWTISLSTAGGSAELEDVFVDRHKYVARITEYGTSENMRAFKLSEFAVDSDIIERTAFTIIIGSPSYIRWVNVKGSYQAPVYEGGTGTTPATSIEKITHRGNISVYP